MLGKYIDVCPLGEEPAVEQLYGIAPVHHTAAIQAPADDFKPAVHVVDRQHNTEAMIVGFLAEKSLPFSLVGK